MAEKEPKRYDIFVPLFGAILSIADPVTDILTLVEFYRTDHKTWFGVGLIFIIFPFFFFFLIYCFLNQSIACKFTHVLVRSLVLGCNPLLPAWLKLRTLYCYLKKLLKLWQGNNTDQTDDNLDDLLALSKVGVLAEAALESAPQFIIQLYAMAVQQQSVSIIQMVSLPVSFLNIAWASTVADGLIQTDFGDLMFSMKDRVLLFVTHLFILSSRLFAVALFTVSYKWWVTSVLILHCTVITICDRVWLCAAQSDDSDSIQERCVSVICFCLHWLRDDLSLLVLGEYAGYTGRLRMQLISNVLFVIENITLILLFYFSHFPHTWYSLPVTICVCLFALLGAVMRLTHLYFLYKDSDDQSNNKDRV
ncbi:unnamed protein product [Porites evermanni]|uniref:XK-related protein n=1 Tax=Porites evermanni TaxID=104178 RepID=A0ABN8SY46_9CNID|nr:unnamed protein product [Porites evermanni]